MSDTTITLRKRKELREYALDCKGEMNRNYFICHLEPDTVLNLLDTIEQAESRIDGGCIEELKRATELAEQAEARAERAEKELAGADAEITELRDELEDSRGTEKDAPNILCAIARLVGVFEHCQELGDDVGEMTLDAVRDLLADKQIADARALRWTHEPPKVAGFFLAESSLDDCGKRITPIEVFSSDHWRHSDWEKRHGKLSCLLCLGGFGVCPVSRYSRFAGPIAPPID